MSLAGDMAIAVAATLEEAVVEHDGRPRNPFPRGGLPFLLSLPGFREQFRSVVPESHLTAGGVRCCSGEVVVPAREVVPCPGECLRHFLRTGEVVRVARWPRGDGDGD